jgi:hypothetical protein
MWVNKPLPGTSLLYGYCHVSRVCVTIKTGVGFDDRINCSFIQPVTTLHKSLSDTLSSSSDWTLHGNYCDAQLKYSVVLHQFWSELRLTVPSYNSPALTPREIPSSVVKNACLLVRYRAMDVLLLKAYASRMWLPSRCQAMGIYITIHYCLFN